MPASCQKDTFDVTFFLQQRGNRLSGSSPSLPGAFIEGVLIDRIGTTLIFALRGGQDPAFCGPSGVPDSCSCSPDLSVGLLRIDIAANSLLGSASGINADCLGQFIRLALAREP